MPLALLLELPRYEQRMAVASITTTIHSTLQKSTGPKFYAASEKNRTSSITAVISAVGHRDPKAERDRQTGPIFTFDHKSTYNCKLQDMNTRPIPLKCSGQPRSKK
jgi:hypothetical protein